MPRRTFGSIREPEGNRGWQIVFSVRGERRKRQVRDRRDARRKLAAIEEMASAGRTMAQVLREVFGEVTGHGMTFREAAPLFLEYREPRKKASTFKADVYRLRVILRASWTKKALDAVSTRDLATYVSRRMAGKHGVSGATANRDMTVVSALFKWAMKMGYASVNPVRSLESESEKGRARTEWLTNEEIDVLLAAAHPEFRPALLCLVHAGLRRGELMTVEWRSVDLDNQRLIVEPEFTKTGSVRHVRLTKELKQVLRQLRSDRRPGEPVFVRPANRLPHSEGSLRYWLNRTLAACPEESSIAQKHVTLHVLRHTFASCLAQEGAPFQEIAYLMGHLSTHVTERYTHMRPDAGKRSIELLDRRFEKDGSSEVREPLSGLRRTHTGMARRA